MKSIIFGLAFLLALNGISELAQANDKNNCHYLLTEILNSKGALLTEPVVNTGAMTVGPNWGFHLDGPLVSDAAFTGVQSSLSQLGRNLYVKRRREEFDRNNTHFRDPGHIHIINISKGQKVLDQQGSDVEVGYVVDLRATQEVFRRGRLVSVGVATFYIRALFHLEGHEEGRVLQTKARWKEKYRQPVPGPSFPGPRPEFADPLYTSGLLDRVVDEVNLTSLSDQIKEVMKNKGRPYPKRGDFKVAIKNLRTPVRILSVEQQDVDGQTKTFYRVQVTFPLTHYPFKQVHSHVSLEMTLTGNSGPSKYIDLFSGTPEMSVVEGSAVVNEVYTKPAEIR